MKITKFDKATCKMVSGEINKLLDGLKEIGLTAKVAGGLFNDNKYTVKVEIVCPTEDGKSGQQAEFERCAALLGLQPTDFGRVFQIHGKTCKIVGVKLSSRKYPLLAECNGKVFKFSAEEVKELLQ